MFLARHMLMAVEMRPQLMARLEREGGRHLVIVHYGSKHSVHNEWVYNRADIDASDIVWAQDMGAEANRELVEYYRDRKIWLFQPDIDTLAITPYGAAGGR
jgi:hypothetical protein